MRYRWLRERLFYSALYTGLFIVACAVIQYGPRWYGHAISSNATFIELDYGHWTANLAHLENGEYFVSVGRPRGRCQVLLDGHRIASNFVEGSPYRSQTMLSASFDKIRTTNSLSIECLAQEIFPSGLTGQPFITTRVGGQVLQLWRELTQVTLGPIVAAFLLLFLGIGFFVSSFRPNRTTLGLPVRKEILRQRRLAAFAAVAFAYTISLSHVLYLFLEPSTGATVHIVLRSIYAMAFLFFFVTHSSAMRTIVLALHTAQIIATLLLAMISPKELNLFYQWSFVLFVASSAFATFTVFRSGETRSNFVLTGATASWTILQPFDLWASFYLFWESLSPAFITVLCACLVLVDATERWLALQATAANSEMIARIRSGASLRSIAAALVEMAPSIAGFRQVSVYLDPTLLGGVSDSQLATRRMNRAMREDVPMIGRTATSKGCYMLLPIANIGCITFSDDTETSWRRFSDNLDFLERLTPVWQSFRELAFTTAGAKSREALENALAHTRAFSTTASKAAHDIRSPLTALNVLAKDASRIETAARNRLLAAAVERIRSIAEDLLSASSRSISDETISIEQIQQACEAVVEQTRLIYASTPGISIQMENRGAVSGVFIRASLSELQRCISNLLNNAVEAIDRDGSANLQIESTFSELKIVITDNGRGIPEDLLPRLGTRGFSVGKRVGTGLGLYSANHFAAGVGGRLTIRSILGQGTQITLSIPTC